MPSTDTFNTLGAAKQAEIIAKLMELFKGNERGYGVGEIKGAKFNEPWSQLELAKCYHKGEGTKKDLDQAAFYYDKVNQSKLEKLTIQASYQLRVVEVEKKSSAKQ